MISFMNPSGQGLMESRCQVVLILPHYIIFIHPSEMVCGPAGVCSDLVGSGSAGMKGYLGVGDAKSSS